MVHDKRPVSIRTIHREAPDQDPEQLKHSQMIGNSNVMRDLFERVAELSDSDNAILILGESGSGKEVLAQTIHYNANRADGAFVRFNCSILPPDIVESELFGHEKGNPGPGQLAKSGRFEEADGGTIVLDEVGALSLSAQARLLGVILSGEFRHTGGTAALSVDTRIILTNSRDLREKVTSGAFRQDLYEHLEDYVIAIPPLRERGSDILLLADHFVEMYANIHKSSVRRISSAAIEMLCAYHWPGNVRELESVIERAVIQSDDGVIHGYHLPPTLQTPESSDTRCILKEKLDQVERETIIEAIKVTKGNMAQAARELGLTERVMGLRMQKHKIDYRLYRPKA